MGTRVKTFLATGVAPDGRLYAGDLNAIQDDYADLVNFAQTIDLAAIRIGETGLQLVRFGALDARITGALRADKIIRGLGGLYAGAFTTAQRDALAVVDRPYGLVILNTTTNQLEINIGTDVTPNWVPTGGFARSTTALTASLDALFDAIIRPVNLTIAQRDALAAGRRPKGAVIYNTDTGGVEVNTGTDAAPVWRRVGIPPVVTAGSPPGSPQPGDKYIQDVGTDLVELIYNDASGVWESPQVMRMDGSYGNVAAGVTPLWNFGVGPIISLPFFKQYFDAGLRLQVKGFGRCHSAGPAHSLDVGVYVFNDGEGGVGSRIAGRVIVNIPAAQTLEIEPNWQNFPSYAGFTQAHAVLVPEVTLGSGNTGQVIYDMMARWIR
jgi:hypothetical protein